MNWFLKIFKDTPPRINLFFIAIILKMGYSSLLGISPQSFLRSAYWTIGFWLLWFGALGLIVWPQTDKYLARWSKQLRVLTQVSVLLLALGGLVVAGSYLSIRSNALHASMFPDLLQGPLAVLEDQPHYCDGTALVNQAAEDVIQGNNPYSSANVITALQEFDKQFFTQHPYTNVTPLQIGSFAALFPYPTPEQLDAFWQQARLKPGSLPDEIESHLCYPAGSFLLMTPFLLAGINNIQYFILFFFLAALGLGLWLIPPKGRVLFLLAMVLSLELWITGIIEVDKRLIVLPFMLAGWLLIPKKPLIAMGLFGIAAATYQTSWFLIPFAAIYVYRTWGLKKATKGLVLTGFAFVLLNLPFIAADPVLWVKSVFAPMIDPLYPMGVGLVALVQTGIIHVASSTLFTVMEFIALAGGLAWYLRYGWKYPAAALPLSILPVFFSWRSLVGYFYYIDVILLAVILVQYYSKERATRFFMSRHELSMWVARTGNSN